MEFESLQKVVQDGPVFERGLLLVDWFLGYQSIDLGNDQTAFVATAEKSLMDLVYLQPQADSVAYLHSLRLQALDQIKVEVLRSLATVSGKPKLMRAVESIESLMEEEGGCHAL